MVVNDETNPMIPSNLCDHLTFIYPKCFSQELKLHWPRLAPKKLSVPFDQGSLKTTVTLNLGAPIFEAVSSTGLSHWTTNLKNIPDQHGGRVNPRHTFTHKVIVRVTANDLKSLTESTKVAAIWHG